MSNQSYGFVIEPRETMYNEWYTDPLTMHLYRHCRLRANYADAKWQGIELKRGQFITSIPSLSEETGLSYSQVRTALKKLKKSGYLTDKPTTKYRIITVLGYDEEQYFSRQMTDKSQADDSQIAADNNNNKENNNNKSIAAKRRFDNSGFKKINTSYDINELKKIDTLDFMDEDDWEEKAFNSDKSESTGWDIPF